MKRNRVKNQNLALLYGHIAKYLAKKGSFLALRTNAQSTKKIRNCVRLDKKNERIFIGNVMDEKFKNVLVIHTGDQLAITATGIFIKTTCDKNTGAPKWYSVTNFEGGFDKNIEIQCVNITKEPEQFRVGLDVKKWSLGKKIIEAQFPAIIRNNKATINLWLREYLLSDNRPLKDTFILEMDSRESENAHASKLPLNGWGSHLFHSYGTACNYIAEEFCNENELIINMQLSHWPLLQYVVSRTPIKKSIRKTPKYHGAKKYQEAW